MGIWSHGWVQKNLDTLYEIFQIFNKASLPFIWEYTPEYIRAPIFYLQKVSLSPYPCLVLESFLAGQSLVFLMLSDFGEWNANSFLQNAIGTNLSKDQWLVIDRTRLPSEQEINRIMSNLCLFKVFPTEDVDCYIMNCPCPLSV